MDARMRGEAGMALSSLIEELMADGTLDDADLARIADATARERGRIADEKGWAETAHVCDAEHAAVVTAIPTEGLPEDQWPEEVDASGLRCHDCGRELVSDAGSIRILVCPRLHGRRGQLRPEDEHGAVECGRP